MMLKIHVPNIGHLQSFADSSFRFFQFHFSPWQIMLFSKEKKRWIFMIMSIICSFFFSFVTSSNHKSGINQNGLFGKFTIECFLNVDRRVGPSSIKPWDRSRWNERDEKLKTTFILIGKSTYHLEICEDKNICSFCFVFLFLLTSKGSRQSISLL